MIRPMPRRRRVQQLGGLLCQLLPCISPPVEAQLGSARRRLQMLLPPIMGSRLAGMDLCPSAVQPPHAEKT